LGTPVVTAVDVILQLSALAEYLIPSICSGDLHEGMLGIQVVPFFQKLKEFNYKDVQNCRFCAPQSKYMPRGRLNARLRVREKEKSWSLSKSKVATPTN
jgi:hypothetical protein